MNPYDDQAMMEEVIYLHSLWHQGPPNRNPNPIPTHSPYPHPNSRSKLHNDPSRNLHVTNHTHFKNTSRHRVHNIYNHRHPQPPPALPTPDPGPEWHVEETRSVSSGWPQLEPKPVRTTRPIPSEEQAKISAMKAQLDAVQTCRAFLGKKVDDEESEEDNEDDEFDDGDADYLSEKEKVEDGEEFRLFLSIFVEKSELRDYYESNHECGEFVCFVCSGIGERIGRKFKDCSGLVQHSMCVSKTKKRKAHRAFAQVVCKVLAWDMDKLPVIVVKGEPLSRSLGITQGSGTSWDSVGKWPAAKPGASPTALGWPTLKSHTASEPNVVTAEEQARVTAKQLQQKVLHACQHFFARTSGSDHDDDDDDEEDTDTDVREEDSYSEVEENHEGDDPVESEVFKFFLKIFKENSELSNYYRKNSGGGDFCCLVCGGIGKKVWKKFKDCQALLQHSTAILRTKKKLAHRAFAHVVCEVLGWDINRLPAIVLKQNHPSSLTENSTDGHNGNANTSMERGLLLCGE